MDHVQLENQMRRPALKKDIAMIAGELVRDTPGQADLRQEMWCQLLSLPEGRPRRFYLRTLRRVALRYWGRQILDAPLGRCGRPILERQTVPVGGLAELDRIHRQQAA